MKKKPSVYVTAAPLPEEALPDGLSRPPPEEKLVPRSGPAPTTRSRSLKMRPCPPPPLGQAGPATRAPPKVVAKVAGLGRVQPAGRTARKQIDS